MIEVNYKVKTDLGNNQQEIYYPADKIRNINGNIMMIEGGNSSGKTTLMNLIAIGMFGEDDESLSKSMRSNLLELTESDYRSISYDINITDPVTNNELELVRKEGSSDLIVLENGQRITKQQFRHRYNLIYDIPENPTARLKNISKAIRDDHRMLSNRIADFNTYLASIKGELDEAISEKDAEKAREEISSARMELDDLRSKTDEITVSKMRTIVNILEYRELQTNISSLEKKLDFEKKKPTPDISSKQFANAIEDYKKTIDQLRPASDTIIQMTRNESLKIVYRDIKDKWSEISRTEPKDQAVLFNEYKNLLDRALGLVPDMTAETKHLENVNTAIDALRRLSSDEQIGSLGCISEILQAFEDYRGTIADRNVISALNKVKEDLTRIKNKINPTIIKKDRLMNQSISSSSVSGYRDEEEIKRLSTLTEAQKKRMDEISSELRGGGYSIQDNADTLARLCKDLSFDFGIKLSEAKIKLDEFSSSQSNFGKDIARLEKYIKSQEEKLEKYESQPTYNYLNEKSEISTVINAIRAIRGKLKTADERLDCIENKDRSEYDKNPSLYQPIWDYIGYRLGTVRNIGREYNVQSVDLLIEEKGLITTTEGTTIHIGAMGTGEGQLSYIRGLLSNEDGRVLVVLLDEIGNMSNRTLEFVKERLMELQRDGKLLLGIMVRPGDDLEVTTYGL